MLNKFWVFLPFSLFFLCFSLHEKEKQTPRAKKLCSYVEIYVCIIFVSFSYYLFRMFGRRLVVSYMNVTPYLDLGKFICGLPSRVIY